jgi:hypothetical protein
MGKKKSGTVRGAYSSDDMGKDPVVEMDKSRTKNFSCADGKSVADIIDRNSEEPSNFGMAASVKRKR